MTRHLSNPSRHLSTCRQLDRHGGVYPPCLMSNPVKHPLGRGVVEPLLAESNWSNRQIAEIAGVSEITVRRTATNDAVERPAETLGADGRLRPAFRPRLEPEPYFAERTVTAVSEARQ